MKELSHLVHASSKFSPLAVVFCLVFLNGCQKAKTPEEKSRDTSTFEPKVSNGQDVEFPEKMTQPSIFKTTEGKPVYNDEVRFTGRVTWNEDYAVRVYTPVAGQVAKIVAESGQKVAPGDDLALIHSSDYGQALSDYLKATATLSQAEKTYKRQKELTTYGAAATKDVEQAQADYENAVAEKDRALAALQRYGKPTGDFSDLYHLRSPIGGYVVDKKINNGQEVRPDMILGSTTDVITPLFTIADPNHLWVLLDVPETNLNELKVGQEIELRTPAYPGRIFAGKLTVVGASLDPQTRVVHTRANVENPDGALKAEMYVTVNVKVPMSGTPSVEVPASAVIFLDGKYYVFVPDRINPNKFSRREVTVLHERSAGATVILQGVQPGERVVSDGSLEMNEYVTAGPGEDSKSEATVTPNP
ncbi:MAG: efflux RND transporter periplasmic adaptor subunit [Verrucomicrobia bacterium]|nr:efflux RND transporter periplasmic adaptor subunit [Verrucomicrobiota bacterium]